MSFENFPEKEQSITTKAPEKKNNVRAIITWGLLAALLGTWGYIIWDKNKTSELVGQKDTVIASTTSQRDELQKELEDATSRYDELKTTNAQKDSTITNKDREIAEKQMRIKALLSKQGATSAEYAEAKRLISSLNTSIESYKTQIETLQGEKVVLIQEKEVVTKERDVAKQETEVAKTVIKEKDDLLDVGSTLHASNFNIMGINEKRNGKEKATTTAKRVDKFRISFDLDENRISQSGNKDIYVCITAPDGKPVAVEALGSGSFKTREGEEKLFTQRMDVNYTQGQRQTLSFDWKQNSSFDIGNYKIEVYHNGFKIGNGTLTLKKGGIFS
jgi:hypothetical protein